MAENDEYYKELVAKQQELLVTLISPKNNLIIQAKSKSYKSDLLHFPNLSH